MKILQINNFEAIGGGSERVYQLSVKMLLDRGHEVATLSCGDTSFDQRKRSTLLKRNAYMQANPLATLRNIRNFVYRDEAAEAVVRLVREFQPDVAHLHIFYGQLSSSVLAALNVLGVPCVMTVHEYRMLCPVSTMYSEQRGVCERCAGGAPIHALLGRCNRGSVLASGLSVLEAWTRDRHYNYANRIAHFFMVSRFCLEKHKQFKPELAAKASVLYNFISDTDVVAAPNSVKTEEPFLYCGRLSQEKGVGLLCEAFAQRPDLQLRIAGGGPLEEDLRRRYAHLSNVRFLGKLGSVDLKRELAAAHFSIAPSEWYENNPMAILESFALGTPVIGANIGGIPELVRHDSTGLLFEPSDLQSLLRALDIAQATSAETRIQMGEAAIQLIRRQHNEGGYYTQLMTGYRQAIDEAAQAQGPARNGAPKYKAFPP